MFNVVPKCDLVLDFRSYYNITYYFPFGVNFTKYEPQFREIQKFLGQKPEFGSSQYISASTRSTRPVLCFEISKS
jgi:hypothetical protein